MMFFLINVQFELDIDRLVEESMIPVDDGKEENLIDISIIFLEQMGEKADQIDVFLRYSDNSSLYIHSLYVIFGAAQHINSMGGVQPLNGRGTYFPIADHLVHVADCPNSCDAATGQYRDRTCLCP